LDEATLQSYFDGELSPHLMERASAHLASCVTCAATARELAEETALLTSALAAEFEESVPTQALRERIDAAVLGERVSNAARAENPGLFASLANVFSFSSQRSLGYASLVVVLAFAAIIGLVKFRQTAVPPPQTAKNTDNPEVVAPPSADNSKTIEVGTRETQSVALNSRPVVKRRSAATKPDDAVSNSATDAVTNHVRLIPGERSYLQAIARLDSTIKSNKNAMRPSLQVEYERNLAVVDRAIAATRNAAKSNPNDPDAADFMFAAYQSKVDLLNTIADARLSGGRSH
jgi:anti-sigma factor RsiW